ncbi:MAG: cytochrome d ubiquinol oxidase subunit II [Halioglobus sp.]
MIENLDANQLSYVFLALMGLAVLVYAVLDGFDLGVGILLPLEQSESGASARNRMIASIGPFWDANETWLVLAVGLLLIAFPAAYSLVLRELYLPAVLLLLGLIMRGVAFDFRAKAITSFRPLWDYAFKFGSLLTAMMLGYMLGRYVLGFEQSVAAQGFAVLSSLCVTAAFSFIGGSWLVMKTSGDLQVRAAWWARRSLWLTALGIVSVSIANLALSDSIAQRWFGLPQALLFAPIPVVSTALIVWVDSLLKRVPQRGDVGCSKPFYSAVAIFILAFAGLGLSHFPYVVPGLMVATDVASAPSSLRFVLYGTVIVLPVIILYTAFSYRVFWGKTTELRYY